ncbi:acyltransferase family protein [Devosia sp. SL43]|uniref:acyltransferase family protein n=1 Tax=Devosia sp. SL43 TaxID=2806348 RepID=UPI001F24E146|nr:acyltransferase [Devosia sp. SL43]UJW85297.1 acyltransferase [Devosia sp. SL43]
MTLTTLQAGRAIAAIAVVFFHANSFFIPERLYAGQGVSPAINAGYAGVEYFFVLSGFIMMLVHQRDMDRPDRVAPFLWKRIIRIYPFYWVVLFALIGAYFVMPTMGPENARDPLMLISSALLIPNGEGFIVVAAWTLSHEMLFYLLFSTTMLNRVAGALILSAWAMAIIFAAAVPDVPFPISFLLSPYNLLFLFGIGSAYLFGRLPAALGGMLAVVGLVTFPAIAIADVTGMWTPSFLIRTVVLGISGAALVTGLTNLESKGYLRAPAWLVFLGDASYAIYIVHSAALAALCVVVLRLGLNQAVPAGVMLVAISLAATLAGIIAHVLIEKPLLAMLRPARMARAEAMPA